MNRSRHRPALIAFVVVAALACLALGWWQFSRFESNAGTARNLGYALQWPLFAVFFIWAYRRFIQLEDEAELAEALAAEEQEQDAPAHPTPAAPAAQPTARTSIPEGFLPARPAAARPATDAPDDDDPARAEYNRLLADLAKENQ